MSGQSEETVTKILSSQEIIHKNPLNSSKSSLPVNGYNLGNAIKTMQETPSKYGYKYLFVK